MLGYLLLPVVSRFQFCSACLSLFNEHAHPQNALRNLFSNIGELARLHTELLQDLKKQPSMARVFIHYGDYMRMYTQYVNNYERMVATINSMRKNRKFQAFLEDLRERCNGASLMSYLIMPVQRIPRYVLFLRELLKKTLPSDPEYRALQEALHKVEETTKYVNEEKRAVENMTRLIDIQNLIKGTTTETMKPGRRFICEGIIGMSKGVLKKGKNQVKDRRFFLFNDMLMWASLTYKFKGSADLEYVSVSDDERTYAELHHTYTSARSSDGVVHNPEHLDPQLVLLIKIKSIRAGPNFMEGGHPYNWAMYFKEKATKEIWASHLEEAIDAREQLVDNVQERRKSIGGLPGVIGMGGN